MDGLHLARRQSAPWIAESVDSNVVVAVDVFHEPVDVEEVMGQVEPSVEDKQVDEDLEDEFCDSKLILSACPIAIERSQAVHLPQPYGGVEQQAKQRDHSHFDLKAGGGHAIGSLRSRVGVL